MADNFTQTSAPKNKVIAATGGAAVGSSISVILTYILNSILGHFGISLPDEVSGAFSTLFTTAVTLAAGYYVPPGANEGVLVTDGVVRSAIKT